MFIIELLRAGARPLRLLISGLVLCAAHVVADDAVKLFDPRAAALIDERAKLEVLGEGYAWTEGPLWVSEGTDGPGFLLFSDIPNNVIHRYVKGEGIDVYLRPSGATALHPGDSHQGSNGLLLNGEGELVLFQQGDRRVAVMDAPLSEPQSRYRTLSARFQGQRLNSPNDGVFDRLGNLYFTDPPYGLNEGFDDPDRELPFQGVYRLSPDGTLTLVDDGLAAPNGIALAKDGGTLYVAISDDSYPHWVAYDLAEDGSPGARRLFLDASAAARQYPGMPDGMVVHSSGVIFATGPGGVWLLSPDGEVLGHILTGRITANCTLSADEKTLYMTAHDALLAISLR